MPHKYRAGVGELVYPTGLGPVAVKGRARSTRVIRTCKCGIEIKRKSTCCRECFNAHRGTKINWPPRDELLEMLADSNYLQVGLKLSVSDNAIRKHLATTNHTIGN